MVAPEQRGSSVLFWPPTAAALIARLPGATAAEKLARVPDAALAAGLAETHPCADFLRGVSLAMLNSLDGGYHAGAGRPTLSPPAVWGSMRSP